MTQALRVDFDGPEHNWIRLRVRSLGQDFDATLSSVSHEGFSDLVLALAMLNLCGSGSADRTVLWGAGSLAFEFRFGREGERVSLEIRRFESGLRGRKDGRRLLTAEGSFAAIARPFWKALRDLESRVSPEDFERDWRPPFPKEALARLTESLKRKGPPASRL